MCLVDHIVAGKYYEQAIYTSSLQHWEKLTTLDEGMNTTTSNAGNCYVIVVAGTLPPVYTMHVLLRVMFVFLLISNVNGWIILHIRVWG